MTLYGRDLASSHGAGDAVAATAGQHRAGGGLQIVSGCWQCARLFAMTGAAGASRSCCRCLIRLLLFVLVILLAWTHNVRLHPGAQLGAEHVDSASLSVFLSLSSINGRIVSANGKAANKKVSLQSLKLR